MELRPYQEEAKESIFEEWNKGVLKTLLVLPTGCGKTVVFAKVAEDCVRRGDRVLILAHRGGTAGTGRQQDRKGYRTWMRDRKSRTVLPGKLVPDHSRIGPDLDEGETAGAVPGGLF